MATLPSVEQLVGNEPVPQPSGRVVGYRVPDASGAVRGLGEAAAQIYDTIDRIDTQLTTSRRATELNTALGQATGEISELELGMRRDQDFKTSPKRFADASAQMMSKYQGQISDPVVKAAFTQRFGELALSKRLSVISNAAKQEGDYNVSQLDSNLSLYAAAAANSTSDAEKAAIVGQADVSIAAMIKDGWITDVDGQKRRQGFNEKLELATVTRDATMNAYATATKLATDNTYGIHIPPDMRERLIDNYYRRSETDRIRAETEANKLRQQQADEGLKGAWDALAKGGLTTEMVESLRPTVTAGEYHTLQSALKNQGKADVDGNNAYAQIQRVLYPPNGGPPDVNEVQALAFRLHAQKQITDSTLGTALSKSRELARSEGPRSPYERNRKFITDSLEPSQMTMDPAPRARQALAVKEFDDWALSKNANPPSDDDYAKKADEIVKKRALIDMRALAEKTSGVSRENPTQALTDLESKARKARDDFASNKISRVEFDKQMAELNKIRREAEKANGGK